MTEVLFGNLSLLQVIGIFVAGIGTTLIAKNIKKTKFEKGGSMSIEKTVDDWYEETRQQVEGFEGDSASTSVEITNGKSKQDDQSKTPIQDKLQYIQKHNEVSTNSGDQQRHKEIGEAVASLGVKAPDHQDSVAKLEQTLTQDDANVETIQNHLQSVMNIARVCEFYRERYYGEAPLIPVDENDVSRKVNSESVTTEFFNDIFEDFQNKTDSIDELKTRNDHLERENKTLRNEKEKLESSLETKKREYADLESNVEDFLSDVEQYTYPTPQYKNANKIDRKLNRLPTVIEKGNIKNRMMEDLIEYLRSETMAANYDMTSDVMKILEDVNDQSINEPEAADILSKIIEKEKLISEIENVDEKSVKNRASTIEERAKDTPGVAADEIARELSDGKIHKILHRQPDADLVYAIDVTLDHFESLLNTIHDEMDLATSIQNLHESIQSKRENVRHYFDNRPEYNHYITEDVIEARLQAETREALDLANTGETDEALGRLYLIQVLYGVLEELYVDQRAQSAMELANQ